jgi:hypothetical protein
VGEGRRVAVGHGDGDFGRFLDLLRGRTEAWAVGVAPFFEAEEVEAGVPA